MKQPPAQAIMPPTSRVIIPRVYPEFDGGRYPIQRTPGEWVTVEADIFADGVDPIIGEILYRKLGAKKWSSAKMEPIGNDRWCGKFQVAETGEYVYTIRGSIDYGAEWRTHLAHREDATPPTLYEKELHVRVDRVKCIFSAWYEVFPRSTSDVPGKHGTFKDCIARLPYIAKLGFDVLYLPPIHPIGRTERKGKNHALQAGKNDPGSPWGIGSPEGGYTAIHPELGTMRDFQELIREAKKMSIEIALDIAFQCSPDHPYIQKHPEWFRKRSDGTIQYAENPPKKYQDIYPLNFECKNWKELWKELLNVFIFWGDAGVRIFRVDNPHTKPFRFWEWVIAEVFKAHPDTIFLSEAFTRPKVMHHLAKLGFHQSYTYFTWRNTKWELMQYLDELTKSEVREYFRPNFFTNTPDILTEYLQKGGPAAFAVRLILSATMSSNYGIYGPSFENAVHEPFAEGSEEYLHSEKYEIKHWDWDVTKPLPSLIAKVNDIRKKHPALQTTHNIQFHTIENDQLICYSKVTEDFSDILLIIVNLDPRNKQAGTTQLHMAALGTQDGDTLKLTDRMDGMEYVWNGSRNYVELDPAKAVAHIFHVKRK